VPARRLPVSVYLVAPNNNSEYETKPQPGAQFAINPYGVNPTTVRLHSSDCWRETQTLAIRTDRLATMKVPWCGAQKDFRVACRKERVVAFVVFPPAPAPRLRLVAAVLSVTTVALRSSRIALRQRSGNI
jgi:hypothetical protein